MTEAESTSKRVARLLDTVAVLSSTIRRDPQATIVPAPDDPDTGAGRAIAKLAGQTAQVGSLTDRVRLEGAIGSGGMGEVLLAEQVSVGRKVAVKRLRGEVSHEAAVSALLREGWVTGTLEHPNVVPLYDLGLDEHGRPLMVLKRIEGAQWRELIDDTGEIRRRFGTGLLEWNIQILMHLCNALGFAHSKGIVHRDVKPENVMIGEFGEVVLLDWGIAVSLDDDGTGRLPPAKNLRGVAGTPSYMAPEMLDPGPGKLSARTDVYLLGAILHEVLAGRPPHEAESLEGFIESVLRSVPQLPEDAPAELAQICRRAMSPSPGDRFESAEELRLALQAYLDHRGSTELAHEAGRRLDELEARLEGAKDASEDRVALYEKFSACRFGFRQALAAWTGNAVARAGLGRAIVLMVEFELAHGDPRAAAGLLAELGADAPKSVEARVQEAVTAARAQEGEIEDLRAFRRDRDSRTGRRTRRFIVALMGLAWTLLPLTASHFPEGQTRHEIFIIVPSVSMLVIAGLAWWARDSVRQSYLNRSIIIAMLSVLAVEAALSVAGWAMGLDAASVQVLHFVPWAAVSAFIAGSFAPPLWWVAPVYIVCMLVSAWRIELRFFAMAVGHILMTLAVAAWAPIAAQDRT